MEQQPEQTMREVSRDRTFVATQENYLTTMIVFCVSGMTLGITLCHWIIMKYPANFMQTTTTAAIALGLLQVALLIPQFLKMRKWKQDLRAERERFLEMYKARIDALLPNDPIQAARAKTQMEEQWPIP